jgi:hypothetical protein
MILLYNVCITPDSSSHALKYNRGLLPSFDKIDILKYSLSSLACIPWEEAIINIELSKFYKIFENNIKEYVEREFKNINFKYSNKRCKSQKEWQKVSGYLLKHEDKILFYCGNHDHIFMSPNLNIFSISEKFLINDNNVFTSIIYSHRSFYHTLDHNYNNNFSYVKYKNFDAMTCLKCRSFWEFWNSFDAGDKFIPRSDWLNASEQNIEWVAYCPHKTFCEHFDGGGYDSNYPINNDPPYVIPPGFFEHDIKIKFCGERKEGYFYINPNIDNHSCVDPSGADAFWTLDDIPLFWKSRISCIEIDSNIDIEKTKNNSIIKNIKSLHPYVFVGNNKKLQLEIIMRYKNILFDSNSMIESIKEGLNH